jgi:hypothetical protein
VSSCQLVTRYLPTPEVWQWARVQVRRLLGLSQLLLAQVEQALELESISVEVIHRLPLWEVELLWAAALEVLVAVTSRWFLPPCPVAPDLCWLAVVTAVLVLRALCWSLPALAHLWLVPECLWVLVIQSLPRVLVVVCPSRPVLVCLVAICLCSAAVDLKVSVALCPSLAERAPWVEAQCLLLLVLEVLVLVAMWQCLLVLPLTRCWVDLLLFLDLRLLSRVWWAHLYPRLLGLWRCSLVILLRAHLGLFLFPVAILRLEAVVALTFPLAEVWEACRFRPDLALRVAMLVYRLAMAAVVREDPCLFWAEEVLALTQEEARLLLDQRIQLEQVVLWMSSLVLRRWTLEPSVCLPATVWVELLVLCPSQRVPAVHHWLAQAYLLRLEMSVPLRALVDRYHFPPVKVLLAVMLILPVASAHSVVPETWTLMLRIVVH